MRFLADLAAADRNFPWRASLHECHGVSRTVNFTCKHSRQQRSFLQIAKANKGGSPPALPSFRLCSIGGDMQHKIAIWGLRMLVLGALLAALGWLLTGASAGGPPYSPQANAASEKSDSGVRQPG